MKSRVDSEEGRDRVSREERKGEGMGEGRERKGREGERMGEGGREEKKGR